MGVPFITTVGQLGHLHDARRASAVGSDLLDGLVEDLATGCSSSRKVRKHSEGSLRDAKRMGATMDHPALAGFASAGAYGKHPGNIDRDSRRFLKRTRTLYGFHLHPYTFDLELLRSTTSGTYMAKHSALLPHE
eukprot:11080013-Alexandrium_andersonii.AAC.1